MKPRLHPDRLAALPASVRRPAYVPAQHGVGIAHLGLGAFHRAHQAWYVDSVLAQRGGDWRIGGISCRSPTVRDQLQPQAGLYAVAEKSAAGCDYRVIGSIAEALVAPDDPAAAIELMARQSVHIISLTITEKGYQSGDAEQLDDRAHPQRPPRSAIGLLSRALQLRHARGHGAPTLLCCDNLRDNGQVLSRVLLAHMAAADAGAADWVGRNVRFPCTMVDRIVPATTAADLDTAEQALGLRDEGLVATEPFTQWVIENDFAGARPEFELAGAQLVSDVRPFELAKLRLLNGSHSTLAYVGSLLGHTFVHEAIADPDLRTLVTRLMRDEMAPTLQPTAGLEPIAYQQALLARFANPALQHRLRQIAMDGSQKLPQRLLAALQERLAAGAASPAIVFAIAAWMRYLMGRDERGIAYEIDDPLAAPLAAAASQASGDVAALVAAVLAVPGIFAPSLAEHAGLRNALAFQLESIVRIGMRNALQEMLSTGKSA